MIENSIFEDIFNGLTFNLEFISQLRQDFQFFN